jgi:hypothetical protein
VSTDEMRRLFDTVLIEPAPDTIDIEQVVRVTRRRRRIRTTSVLASCAAAVALAGAFAAGTRNASPAPPITAAMASAPAETQPPAVLGDASAEIVLPDCAAYDRHVAQTAVSVASAKLWEAGLGKKLVTVGIGGDCLLAVGLSETKADQADLDLVRDILGSAAGRVGLIGDVTIGSPLTTSPRAVATRK